MSTFFSGLGLDSFFSSLFFSFSSLCFSYIVFKSGIGGNFGHDAGIGGTFPGTTFTKGTLGRAVGAFLAAGGAFAAAGGAFEGADFCSAFASLKIDVNFGSFFISFCGFEALSASFYFAFSSFNFF